MLIFSYQTELVDCANRLGAEMLGLQAELDKSVCSNEVSPVEHVARTLTLTQDLMSNSINSTTVERVIVSTYGRYI